MVLLESLFYLILSSLSKTDYGNFAIAILAISSILEKIVNLMTWSILILVIFSWFSSQKNHPLLEIVNDITSGTLKRIRSLCPPFGSLRFFPIDFDNCSSSIYDDRYNAFPRSWYFSYKIKIYETILKTKQIMVPSA